MEYGCEELRNFILFTSQEMILASDYKYLITHSKNNRLYLLKVTAHPGGHFEVIARVFVTIANWL
jgi:hypothetical protein